MRLPVPKNPFEATGEAPPAATNGGSSASTGALPFIVAVQRELRGPLNALAGVVRELEASAKDERGIALVEMARTSTKALNLLTSDLVALAGVRNGAAAVDPIAFDIRVAMNDLVTAWALSESFGIGLEIDADVPSRLHGQPSHLRRMVTALASTLSSPEAPAPLALSVLRKSESATHVDLEFRISRLGLPHWDPDSLDHSFDLLVARYLATSLGGEIEHGAEQCVLRLPIRKDDVRAPSAPVARVDLTGRNVLVVGPSGPSRVSLQMALRGCRCNATVATSVAEAIHELRRAAASSRPADVCIADLSRNSQQVEALAQTIHDDPSIHGTPVVVLVEVGSSGDASWASSLGSAAYLSKPVKQDELSDVLMGVIAQHEGGSEPTPSSLITRHTIREANARRLKCLVVDDDRVNVLAVQTMLERLGHHVEIAHSGTEALDKAAVQCFDLIVTDVRMPDMDGDQVALVLSARQRDRNEGMTPIIAMTATPHPGDEELCIASGIMQYHRKPITIELLNGIVEQVMSRAGDGIPQQASLEREPAPAAPEHDFMREDAILWDHVEMACHGVPELKKAMLAAFRVQLHDARQQLAVCIEEGRLEELEAAAEACGSCCSSFGALPAARTLARLEKLAADHSIEEIRPLFAELLAELDRVEASLSA